MEVGITLVNELERRISNEFCIFDVHGDKYIDSLNVGHVLRFIGCVPTEKEIAAIVKATETTEYPGEIHLTAFMRHVSQLLMQQKMKPATPEELLKAFETLDPENKRYLTKDYFGKLMAEEGEPFDEEELKAMWPVAIDPITDNIPYIFYQNQLTHETDIYAVAAIVKEEIALGEKERKRN